MSDALSGFTLPRNDKAIRAVVNTSTTVNIASGDVVKIDTSNPMSATQSGIGVIQTTASGDTAYGVAIEAIPIGAQGRVQRAFLAPVVASAAIAVGAFVDATAAGQVVTHVATHAHVGQAVTAAGAAGDPLMIEVSIAPNA